jgi:hypothetical protein
MAINRGPNIIRDGLVLCIDAADKNSYPGSGTTVYDVSGNSYTGTLINSVTFDTEKGGCFYFNSDASTGPYINTNYLHDNYGTLSVWFKGETQDADGGSVLRPLIMQGTFGAAPEAFGISMMRAGLGDSGKIRYDSGLSVNNYLSPSYYNDNKWHNAVLVRDAVNSYAYINGNLLSSFSSYATINKTTNIQLGGSSTNTARRYLGKIATWQVYTKVLSSAEVLQNYNVMKGRFN